MQSFLFDSLKKILVCVSWVVLVAGVGAWLSALLDVSCFTGKRGVDEWILIQRMISEDCQVKSYSIQTNNSAASLRFSEKTVSIIFQWKHNFHLVSVFSPRFWCVDFIKVILARVHYFILKCVLTVLDLASKEVWDLLIETYNTVTCYCISLCQRKMLGRKALPIKNLSDLLFHCSWWVYDYSCKYCSKGDIEEISISCTSVCDTCGTWFHCWSHSAGFRTE